MEVVRPLSLAVYKQRQDGTWRRVLHTGKVGETRAFRQHSCTETWVSTEVLGILASRFSCLTTKI